MKPTKKTLTITPKVKKTLILTKKSPVKKTKGSRYV